MLTLYLMVYVTRILMQWRGIRVEPAMAVIRSRRGQVTLEYFLIASVFAIMTFVGMSGFHTGIRLAVERFMDLFSEAFAH